NVTPVMYDARSEARKATAAAISAGSASRPAGICAAQPATISSADLPIVRPRLSANAACCSVSVQPGAMLLTVTPSAANTLERVGAQPVKLARTDFDTSHP